jgi:hypothetical protein
MLAEIFLMRIRTLVSQPGRDTPAQNPRFVPIKQNPPPTAK